MLAAEMTPRSYARQYVLLHARFRPKLEVLSMMWEEIYLLDSRIQRCFSVTGVVAVSWLVKIFPITYGKEKSLPFYGNPPLYPLCATWSNVTPKQFILRQHFIIEGYIAVTSHCRQSFLVFLNYFSTTNMKATASPETSEAPIFQNKVPHSRKFSKQECLLSSLTHFSLLETETSAIIGDCKLL